MRIALLQISPTGTIEGNEEKGLLWCGKAKEAGAEIALFPEMWSIGYDISGPAEAWKAQAIPITSPFISSFREEARKLGIAIAITFLEKTADSICNSMLLIDGKGNDTLHYSKVHTCEFGDEYPLEPGDDFHTAVLETEKENLTIGAMICFDREFPESARVLMLKGAEVILCPNACPMEINRLSQLRARAFENMAAIATCNYPSSVPDCNGHSTVFDGVAYLPDMPGSRDTCILEASEEEGMYIADINLTMLREYRRTEVHGNAYRHPEKYHMLIDTAVSEPFIRSDRKR